MLAAVALAGCAANQQYFQPTERVEGRTQTGRKVAIYPIAVPQGPVGEAKVWSSGAYETDGDETVVRVGLEVHNTSAAPLQVDPGDLRLHVHADDYAPLSGLRPEDEVARAVPPGGIAQLSSTFELPPGISPGDIESMRLDWRVRADGQVYAQSTPFTEEVNPRYYPYGPCGPYGCGSVNWSYGPSIGWPHAPFYFDGPAVRDVHGHHGGHPHGHHGHHGHHHH
jgi:hypothetical protein